MYVGGWSRLTFHSYVSEGVCFPYTPLHVCVTHTYRPYVCLCVWAVYSIPYNRTYTYIDP